MGFKRGQTAVCVSTQLTPACTTVLILGRTTPSPLQPQGVIYCITCNKDSGQCAQLGGPQYIGCTERMLKTRLIEHVGSATKPSQVNTTKTVEHHFRLPGHSHRDMSILSKISQKLEVVEHCMNMEG